MAPVSRLCVSTSNVCRARHLWRAEENHQLQSSPSLRPARAAPPCYPGSVCSEKLVQDCEDTLSVGVSAPLGAYPVYGLPFARRCFFGVTQSFRIGRKDWGSSVLQCGQMRIATVHLPVRTPPKKRSRAIKKSGKL